MILCIVRRARELLLPERSLRAPPSVPVPKASRVAFFFLAPRHGIGSSAPGLERNSFYGRHGSGGHTCFLRKIQPCDWTPSSLRGSAPPLPLGCRMLARALQQFDPGLS